MTRTTKRLVGLAAALILVLTLMLPCVALAESQRDFTGYTPISTKEELDAIRDYPYERYYLTQDIVFTQEDFAPGGAFYNDGAGWEPIGGYSGFEGIFDGNGYQIQGLCIMQADLDVDYGWCDIGFFGEIGPYGIVLNLGVTDMVVTVDGDVLDIYAGSPVGQSAGDIRSCHTSGEVKVTAEDVCLAGGIGAVVTRVSDCYNMASISVESKQSYYPLAGGIAA